MRVVARAPVVATADAWVAGGATAVCGAGTILLLAGLAMGDPPLAVAGALAAGAGLVALFAGGWLPGLLVLAVTLPLPAPYATDTLRVSPAAAATLAVLLGWLLRRAWDRRPIELGGLPRSAVLALFAATVLAAVFAQSMAPALRELVTMALLLGLAVVATDEIRAAPDRARHIALAFAVIAGIAGPLAALEAAGLLPGRFPLAGTGLQRAALGFGWPNELGMFMALLVPFTFYAWHTARTPATRWLAGAGVAAALLGLLATFSRGAWLGFLAGTAVLVFAGDRRLVLRVWLAVAAAVLVLDLGSGGIISGRALSLVDDPFVAQRAALTLTGLLIFQAYPLVGIGPGGFEGGLAAFGPQISWLWDYVGSAHNAYVDVAAQMGAVGLVAFLAFIVATLRVLLRGARRAPGGGAGAEDASLRRALLWSFAVACAVNLTAWPFAHGVGQVLVLTAAAGYALDPGPPEPGGTAGSPRAARAAEPGAP